MSESNELREFVKVFCVLVMSAATLMSAIAWIVDRPDQLTWILRLGTIPVGLLALLVFLRVHFRRDLAPDFLYRTCGKYFDRDGFCFAIIPENVDGVCVLNTYFQNRYESPCVGRIALRQAKGFFGLREMDTIAVEVHCDGGAFGVTRTPIPVPLSMQGRKVKLQVGASSEYPHGKGKMLRFRDGMVIRSNAQFKNPFGRTLTIAGALGGAIVISRPASVTCMLPRNVAEYIESELRSETEILWRLEDALPAARHE